MSRTVYLNGEWLPEADAKVSVFDRGFLFADAIYEVAGVVDGRLVDYEGHVARLKRSAGELGLTVPLNDEELLAAHREIIKRNNVTEGLVYLQLSRGAADREFDPQDGLVPTLVMFTQSKNIIANKKVETGLAIAILPDLRWARRDIKTVQLLYPCLAKIEVKKRGCDDAWLEEDGFITEASAANAHIVTADGTLVTRDLSTALLHGITRASVLDLARKAQIKVEERAFTADEARNAAEAFITSATNFVMPVTQIDGKPVGTGKPGPITMKLRELYIADRVANAI